MEFLSHIHSFWTLIAFIVFIGIVVWAWSSKRSKDFSEAANLPFDNEHARKHEKNEQPSGEHKHV
ncbi:MAG: cbb3-type cytochrome c oxidase subunit 3 [Granulosicoccaceae bacterium]|jgi:cytochrome c oxidase cbb3-type subunit 4